jgi:hypothetical protein
VEDLAKHGRNSTNLARSRAGTGSLSEPAGLRRVLKFVEHWTDPFLNVILVFVGNSVGRRHMWLVLLVMTMILTPDGIFSVLIPEIIRSSLDICD